MCTYFLNCYQPPPPSPAPPHKSINILIVCRKLNAMPDNVHKFIFSIEHVYINAFNFTIKFSDKKTYITLLILISYKTKPTTKQEFSFFFSLQFASSGQKVRKPILYAVASATTLLFHFIYIFFRSLIYFIPYIFSK